MPGWGRGASTYANLVCTSGAYLQLNVDLKHRTILVTGAAQGLGLGIAQRLAAAGACLVLADCNPKVMDQLASPFFAGSATAVLNDLAEPGAAHELMCSALAK